MNAAMPLPRSDGSVCAKTTAISPIDPLVMKFLVPLSTHTSPAHVCPHDPHFPHHAQTPARALPCLVDPRGARPPPCGREAARDALPLPLLFGGRETNPGLG